MDNSDHISKFIHAMKTRRNLSPRTLKAYELDLRAYERSLADTDVLKAEAGDIQTYISRLEDQNLQSSSIRRKLATIKVFYGFLSREGLIGQAPMWKTTGRYRVSRQLPRVISRREVVRILSVAHARAAAERNRGDKSLFAAVRNLLAIELLFSLGLRIDELTRLDVEDIDIHGGTVLVHGKGRKERLLYLSSREVVQLLSEYFRLRSCLVADPCPLLVNRHGDRLGNGSVGRIFSSLCGQAGIEHHYTPHCLRHTMATMLIENGADIRSTQEILGHSSISTTEIYIHVSRKRKREVLQRFNARNTMRLLST